MEFSYRVAMAAILASGSLSMRRSVLHGTAPGGPALRSSLYDKATLGPGGGRGGGTRAWRRWHARHGGKPIGIKHPEKYLHAAARRRWEAAQHGGGQ